LYQYIAQKWLARIIQYDREGAKNAKEFKEPHSVICATCDGRKGVDFDNSRIRNPFFAPSPLRGK
jgi:hypothetical protein